MLRHRTPSSSDTFTLLTFMNFFGDRAFMSSASHKASSHLSQERKSSRSECTFTWRREWTFTWNCVSQSAANARRDCPDSAHWQGGRCARGHAKARSSFPNCPNSAEGHQVQFIINVVDVHLIMQRQAPSCQLRRHLHGRQGMWTSCWTCVCTSLSVVSKSRSVRSRSPQRTSWASGPARTWINTTEGRRHSRVLGPPEELTIIGPDTLPWQAPWLQVCSAITDPRARHFEGLWDAPDVTRALGFLPRITGSEPKPRPARDAWRGELVRSGNSTQHQSPSTHVALAPTRTLSAPVQLQFGFASCFPQKFPDSYCVAVDPCSLVPSASDDSSWPRESTSHGRFVVTKRAWIGQELFVTTVGILATDHRQNPVEIKMYWNRVERRKHGTWLSCEKCALPLQHVPRHGARMTSLSTLQEGSKRVWHLRERERLNSENGETKASEE